MRKLTHNEGSALLILAKRGSLVPGDSVPDWSAAGLMEALNGLVRKKRATVTATDDGPAFHITSFGRDDAEGKVNV